MQAQGCALELAIREPITALGASRVADETAGRNDGRGGPVATRRLCETLGHQSSSSQTGRPSERNGSQQALHR